MTDNLASKLPSKEEYEALPRWARTALAARCARRLQPLFAQHWPDALQDQARDFYQLISIAESSAESAKSMLDDVYPYIDYGNDGEDVHSTIHNAAMYAWETASCAGAEATGDFSGFGAIKFLPKADEAAAANGSLIAATVRDYLLLSEASKTEGWTDATSVPSEFFGPLWPNAAPKDWPDADSHSGKGVQQAIKLQIEVPEGIDEDELKRRIEELLLAASELHIAHGGSGLKLDTLEVWDTVGARVPEESPT